MYYAQHINAYITHKTPYMHPAYTKHIYNTQHTQNTYTTPRTHKTPIHHPEHTKHLYTTQNTQNTYTPQNTNHICILFILYRYNIYAHHILTVWWIHTLHWRLDLHLVTDLTVKPSRSPPWPHTASTRVSVSPSIPLISIYSPATVGRKEAKREI